MIEFAFPDLESPFKVSVEVFNGFPVYFKGMTPSWPATGVSLNIEGKIDLSKGFDVIFPLEKRKFAKNSQIGIFQTNGEKDIELLPTTIDEIRGFAKAKCLSLEKGNTFMIACYIPVDKG